MSKLFNTLRDVLTPYANKINLHTEEIEELQGDVDHLKNGEVVINGVLIQGFYPVATGTISTASSSARTVVFPIESDKTYYVSWLEGTNKYRVAFGDTPADQVVNGTVIFDYIDAESLSHDHLSVTNDDHQYMYVYIGTSSTALINTVEVVKKPFVNDFFDSNLVNISNPGLWVQTELMAKGRGESSQAAKMYFAHTNFSLHPFVKYLDVDDGYQVKIFAFDSNYSPLTNPFIFNYGDIYHTHKIDGGYRIDLDGLRRGNPTAIFMLPTVRAIDSYGNTGIASGIEVTETVAAEHVKILALPSYRSFLNENDYKITPYDWTYGYRSASAFRIVNGSDNALNYLALPRIKMQAGDFIEVFLKEDYQVLCWSQMTDASEGIYFLNDAELVSKKRSIFRAYRECYMCLHIRTETLRPINPVTCPVEIYIRRRKDTTRIGDRNLLLQSRYSEAGDTPLTLVHYSDNHGDIRSIEELERYYCENFDSIDDYLNTGDVVYSYYGYSVDGDLVSDYDESVSYSVGDYVVYSGWFYRCTTATSGEFDSTKWTKIHEFVSNQINAGRIYGSRKYYANSDLAKLSLFVLGNHDTALVDYRTATNKVVTTDTWHLLKQSDAYNSYFAPFIQDWGVTMGSATNACYWYKDYADAKIRLIGVDMAYWDSTEATWLANTLADARTNEYSVILASHHRLGPSTYNPNVSFQTLRSLSDDGHYSNRSGYAYGTYTSGDAIPILTQYEDIIICHLCGHWHADTFGYYDDVDILIVGINQAGGAKTPREEVRLANMENKWLFNAITFNTTDKTVKIVRMGQDTDETLRRKKTLVYNYDTKTIISNN